MSTQYRLVLSPDYDPSQPYRTVTPVRCDNGSIVLKEVEHERICGLPFVGEYRYERVNDELSDLDDFVFEE